MDEMDAVLQLIRLTRDRKLKNEEEQSTGDSTADLSFSSMIHKIRDKKLGSIGVDKHQIMKPLIDKHGKNQERAWHRMLSDNLYLYASSSPKKAERLGRSRRTMNAGDMTQPDMEAAQQLLQLCDNSNRYKYKDVKAKEEEEEESNSDTSYITDDSSPAMETNIVAQQIMQLSRNSDSKYTEEREEEAEDGGEEESESNTSSVTKGGVFMKGCEAFCPRKRKFRSIVDIYRTTKPFD